MNRLAIGAAVATVAFASAGVAFAGTSPCPYSWQHDLKQGSSGNDVRALQEFLNSDAGTQIAASGIGSPGNESVSFGAKTKSAVTKFQELYAADILTPNGLTKGTGRVGASTRAKLNALCSVTSAAAPAPSSIRQTASAAAALPAPTDSLTVSDPGQPASSLSPANAGVPFLNIALAAGNKDVTVRSISVQRAGPGTDGAFSSIALYGEDGLQIGNIKSFDSTHTAILNEPFTIPAGASTTLQVYVNTAADLTDYDGQSPFLQVTAIDASSPIMGTLPLKGSPQTMNSSLAVGYATAQLSPYDPGVSTTHYITDTGLRFSGIRITANSTEDETFSNIIWRQSGTAGPNDLANVVTVADGKSYPAVIANGRDYISTFDPAIVIRKGQSIDVYVQGDFTATGAGRTAKFDIYDNSDDVSLAGNTYGFGIGVVPGGNTATEGTSVFLTDTGDTDGNSLTPFFSGSPMTISAGAMISITR